MSSTSGAPRTVHCARQQRDLPGLTAPPFPGALGRRIFEGVSQAAWDEWTAQEILVINHYALNLVKPAHHDFLMKKMAEFLFEGAPGVDTSQPPTDRP